MKCTNHARVIESSLFYNIQYKTQLRKLFSSFYRHYFLLLIVFCNSLEVMATDYYVSSTSGNDSYDGLAGSYDGTNGPWSSLTKVSGITFNSGDNIFLKTGDTWTNQTLLLKGLGTSTNPITLSTYGTGAKPIISPQIIDAYGITIANTGGWKILGVEIEKARAGIALQFDNTYNNDYIFIDNCNIHDIDDTYNSNPNLYNHISSGILLEGNGASSPYHLTNLTVQNITFDNVNCAWWAGCISTYTNSSGFGTQSRFRYVTVNNLTATNCKQWGYSFLHMEDATITNADADNTGFGTNPYGATGALVAYSKNVVLDGCDFYNSHRGPQKYDGCGFDFEGGVNTSNVTYKNAIIDHADGCGIFVFNNGGRGGTPNLLIENVTISNFGENPGNTDEGINFMSPGNSSGTVKNCTINSTNGKPFYTGYPTVPANFTFTGNTFNNFVLNIAPNATVSASTTDTGNGYSTAKAVDGNTADWSGWASLVGVPQWLQLTWSNTQNINKVDLHTTSGYYLKDYDIEYWNGSAWQVAASVRNNTQKLTTSTFPNVSTSQLRINCITADQTSYCRIDELSVYSSGLPDILNNGFETPAVSNYQYNPTGGDWTFSSGSGVQKNGSDWGAATAPEGVQTCFLQNDNASITQTLNFTGSDYYTVSFQAARRFAQAQTIEVYIDTSLIGTFTPTSNAFVAFTTNSVLITSGTHTLKFQGTTAGDQTAFVDAVSLDIGSAPSAKMNPNKLSLANQMNGEENLSKVIFIYPNPSSDKIFINDLKDGTKVRIYNVNGQMIMSKAYIGSLNISSLPSGIYFLRINDKMNNQMLNLRLIKK